MSFVLLSLCLGGSVQGAQETSAGRGESVVPATELPRDPELPGVRQAVDRGLNYLKRGQLQSGALSGRYPVAVTALGGMAILAAGHGYRGGPYAATLERSVRFLEENSRLGKGYISDAESKMHGHTYAVLFLTQLYGELPSRGEDDVQDRVRRLIEDGLEVIRRAQTPQGGWYYTPENLERQDEASLTICALQALRAANGSGFPVPKTTVDRAVRYVRRCQHRDGSFRYSLDGPDQHTSFALTVAAVSTLHAAGVYDAPEVRKGLDFARGRLAEHSKEPVKAAEREFFSYANLYAAQAFYQAGGELWASWYPSARRYLLRRQSADGSFPDDFGPEFGTSCAVLILLVPVNYLPIFQR